MTPFQLVQPVSLSEALRMLAGDDVRPLSGGTALMLMMKAGVLRPARVVSLAGLGLNGISVKAGALHVGAMTTLREPRGTSGSPVSAADQTPSSSQ